METTERKIWADGDEIYGIVLNCSNGYENRGVRHFRRSEFDVLKVGSAPDCHLRDECMAACHALFELRERKVLVRVVDNVSGVLKNGQRVHGEAPILDGEELRLGDFRIKVDMMRPPVAEAQMVEKRQAMSAADKGEWENNSGPYRHQQAMLSLIEEFKSYYPGNTEILKIEKLAHYDDGRGRDERHSKMLIQLVTSVRSAREFAREKNLVEEEHGQTEREIEEMAEKMAVAFEDLTQDELIDEGLRLLARLSTAGNMTESMLEMVEVNDGDEEFRDAIKLLVEKHQENTNRDYAAFTAVASLLNKKKEQ